MALALKPDTQAKKYLLASSFPSRFSQSTYFQGDNAKVFRQRPRTPSFARRRVAAKIIDRMAQIEVA